MSGEARGKIGEVSGERACVRFGPFSFDPTTRQVQRGTDDIHLTPKAFDLLTLLVVEAPRVVSKAEAHERLWPGTFVSDATLLSLVKELRRALGDRDESAPIIRTAHGVGYALLPPSIASRRARPPACGTESTSTGGAFAASRART
jgi:DNA-binding winged helix-turn-helix (wHTH) protein